MAGSVLRPGTSTTMPVYRLCSAIAFALLALIGCTQPDAPKSTTSPSADDRASAPPATRQTFELSSGHVLELTVPDGWAARAWQTKYSLRGAILEPRTDPHLEADAKNLSDGESATGSHVVIISSGKPCAGERWVLDPIQNVSEAGNPLTGRKASLLSAEGTTCASAKAADREANGGPSAVSVLEQLIHDNAIGNRKR